MTLSLLLLSVAVASAPASSTAALEELRQADLRLATIGYRLATANAALCSEQQPETGLVIHALDQYAPALRTDARAAFGFPGNVAVEAVVAGSPAAQAGARPGDGVVAIDGVVLPTGMSATASVATRDVALGLLTPPPATGPRRLDLVRGDGRTNVTIATVPGCRASFEVTPGKRLAANSDGAVVQVSAGYLARFGDDQIAVIVAHELAHIVLRHRARLEAAGVHWGVLGEVGRNARLFRRTEDEADELGVALLRNAGYDLGIAVAFWRQDIGSLDGGVLHSRTHSSSRARATHVAATIAGIPAGAPTPWIPPLIATREQPLR